MKKETDKIRKILVLRYRSIGDILLANPALAALRGKFPDAVIDIVVDDTFEEVLYKNPNIDKIILHPRKPDGPKWRADLDMIRRLRSEEYDVAIDLHAGPRGAWTAFFSGAQTRIGHSFRLRNKVCYNMTPETPKPEDHTWKVQFMTVRPLGIEWPEKPEFHLAIPKEKASSMRKKMEDAGLMFDRNIVLLHPGARVDIKRWPAKEMGRLARWLVDEKNVAVVLAGSDADVDEIKAIRKTAGYALPYFTDISIGELAALIKSAAMIVCNDSGPMHMAGVLNIPTVSLFGPSDPAIWGPVGAKNISVSCLPPMECQPCDQKNCAHEGDHCMTKIELNDVKQAVNRLGALP